MWDTRSIIVRFRRQRGNTCLPGESKPKVKRFKEEPSSTTQADEQQVNKSEKDSIQEDANMQENRWADDDEEMPHNKQNNQTKQQTTDMQTSQLPAPGTSATTMVQQQQQQQPWVCISYHTLRV